ncbi:MAG TPA: NUDIX domain-containing protein [Mycobacteriales bacterium]|nr:NUDIX domain-containing protein [Mycobacteriales bacterium]
MRQPIDEREAASLRRIHSELRRLTRPFDEDADPVHVTASAAVTGPRGVLLHRHKRLGIWIQPGGHVEEGESLLGAALRETAEETGLVARPLSGELVHVDVHAAPKGHTHLDVRFLLYADGDPCPPEGESPEVAWFGWAEAADLTDAALAPLLRHLARDRPGA